MKTEEVVDYLDSEDEVSEFYVLIREIKAYLDVGHDTFHPCIKIKIYRTRLNEMDLFHFEVSHHVHGPEQAGPYMTSRTTEESERAAIDRAISSTTSFIKSSIQAGHTPSDKWLVPNEFF